MTADRITSGRASTRPSHVDLKGKSTVLIPAVTARIKSDGTVQRKSNFSTYSPDTSASNKKMGFFSKFGKSTAQEPDTTQYRANYECELALRSTINFEEEYRKYTFERITKTCPDLKIFPHFFRHLYMVVESISYLIRLHKSHRDMSDCLDALKAAHYQDGMILDSHYRYMFGILDMALLDVVGKRVYVGKTQRSMRRFLSLIHFKLVDQQGQTLMTKRDTPSHTRRYSKRQSTHLSTIRKSLAPSNSHATNIDPYGTRETEI